jgi:hypothetical protein
MVDRNHREQWHEEEIKSEWSAMLSPLYVLPRPWRIRSVATAKLFLIGESVKCLNSKHRAMWTTMFTQTANDVSIAMCETMPNRARPYLSSELGIPHGHTLVSAHAAAT